MTTTSSRQSLSRIAGVHAPSAAAARAVADQIGAHQADLNFLFVSPAHDLDVVAAEWSARVDRPTVACTTAGEISSAAGYTQGSIVGASITGADVAFVEIPDLQDFDEVTALGIAEETAGFRARHDTDVFGVLIMDGLSLREERVVAHLQATLDNLVLIGGSAGDALAFLKTRVLVGGRFCPNAGVLALLHTEVPATAFMAHHFEPTGRKIVVTAADPNRRRIFEFDGVPAVVSYRRATGITGPLTPAVLATHPLLLKLGGRHFVRALARANDDDSIDLYCAIEEGLVLEIGQPTDILADLRRTLTKARASVGAPSLVLAFDCILRRIELEQFGLLTAAGHLLRDVPLAGFSTYGEFCRGAHVNQTLTGIAFGS